MVGGRILTKSLFYVENKPFQVFAFRMIDVDRVIGRLGKLMQYAHLSAG